MRTGSPGPMQTTARGYVSSQLMSVSVFIHARHSKSKNNDVAIARTGPVSAVTSARLVHHRLALPPLDSTRSALSFCYSPSHPFIQSIIPGPPITVLYGHWVQMFVLRPQARAADKT